jgi:hypothetical protein
MAQLGGKMQRRVAAVIDVRVPDLLGVLGHDAPDQEGVVKGDGSAEPDRDV